MSSLFDTAAALSPEAESMQCTFADLSGRMAAEAKCVPEDRPNLATEKEEWCHRWNKITADIGFYIAAAKDQGVVLALTADEAIQGREAAATHDKFVEQLHTLKEVAALHEMGEEAAANESGEEEIDCPEKRPVRARKVKVPAVVESEEESEDGMVVHEMRCEHCEKKDLECYGPEGMGCTRCKTSKQACSYSHLACAKAEVPTPPAVVSCRPAAGPKHRVGSGHGSEGPILISDGKSAPSNSQPLKAKPVVLLADRKCKLAEVEEEDFALADSGLGGDDLAMAGKLRGVHAKVRTIQGLLADVFNDLDMIIAPVVQCDGFGPQVHPLGPHVNSELCSPTRVSKINECK
ncbi:hypothetical protein BDR03DRAFT_984412 [Suillus americanus]|nr:hypothetical protein BDR03DRAFT_984412 [Suillus americanus]